MTPKQSRKQSQQSRTVEYVPLEEVQPAARNPKRHAVEALVTSMTRFGFADAVVVDGRTGRLVSGHGRLEALRAMRDAGKAPPDGVLVRGDGVWCVPVQRGWASKDDTEAEAFLVAANRLVEAGGWDEEALREVLEGLAAAEALEGVGFGMEDVEKVVADVDTQDAVVQTERWQVLVDVDSESAQAELLRRLESEGYKCRPLMF